MSELWQFWIDVGGTFTDCIGISPTGEIRPFKTLSSGVTRGAIQSHDQRSITDASRTLDPPNFWKGATCRILSLDGDILQSTIVEDFDEHSGRLHLQQQLLVNEAVSYELDLQLPAPVLAIRWLLKLGMDDACPPLRIRFGTTKGTNALLTRTGAKTALVTTRGFADVPLIGNQDRPQLFDLNIQKPEPLFSEVFEVRERISSEGTIVQPLDVEQTRRSFADAELVPNRFDSVAVSLLNAYRNPMHEQQLEAVLRSMGFTEISRSSEVSPQIRFVSRCETTVLDAYLNPVLREYLNEIRALLPGSQIQVMTSTGGLVNSTSFRGRDCILSGPAGGIVGFSRVAQAEGFEAAIGFDMGGTSTDVARFDGEFELQNETMKAGARILSPVLAIETVAAGGGSICGFDGTRLFAGPQSAGATPGPACYGGGGPLTITDLNVFLGRVLPSHFPFPLQIDAVQRRLEALRSQMVAADAIAENTPIEELAEGLLTIANNNMAQAIRKVSIARGYHPGDHTLVSFGGAGGQHACSMARSLGMSTVLIHPFAGILSAYGMGHADVRAIRQASILKPLCDETLEEIERLRGELETETAREALEQGVSREEILPSELSLELRYSGTDSALMIGETRDTSFKESFEIEHERLFGYRRQNKSIEVASVRVETVGRIIGSDTPQLSPTGEACGNFGEDTEVWFEGRLRNARVVTRKTLRTGDKITGPAILCEPTSTVFIEPGCLAEITETGTLRITIGDETRLSESTRQSEAKTEAALKPSVDPVLLEVFNNQFVSIAEQMGETLRRTSTSTNVRERLDYSCALFDQHGRLVVNAPHVPVHLGAMGETVRAIITDHAGMRPGDIFVTNDPYRGGSHLPDVTVVTPVFALRKGDQKGEQTAESPAFYVANRAHHAEIGGIVPGSMPPFSKNLAEEGVLICSRKLVDAGRSCESAMRQQLESGRYPSRAVADNLADLAAQAAANECGARLLRKASEQHTVETVQAYMQHIQTAAAKKMRQCLSQLEDREYSFADSLDDGTRICVRITVKGDSAVVDFTGTAGVNAGNLNANRAITTAAVLYCFRCLLNEPVPLNAGVLEPVEIVIPVGLLNPAPGASPELTPAIVGGNVETSQRIVDVLLGALGLAAASQGTMNNLTFGDETFGYYETICGGAGATPTANGADAVHTHMTNTRLTDPEVLEQRYPVRLRQFSIRRDSGGAGQFNGGNGIIRELEFLKPLHVSMLSQRRGEYHPYGIRGGAPGELGKNTMRTTNGVELQGGSFAVHVDGGTVLTIESPGGGGCGEATTST